MAQYRLHESENFSAMSMGMRAQQDVKPRAGADGAPKLSPSGLPTYASGVAVMRPDGTGQDKTVSISVCEYAEYPMGTVLRTDGAVWVTPYESAGRVAVSVIAERLVPVNTSPSREKREG